MRRIKYVLFIVKLTQMKAQYNSDGEDRQVKKGKGKLRKEKKEGRDRWEDKNKEEDLKREESGQKAGNGSML